MLTTTLSGKLDKAVKAEVKSSVVPTVQKVLNSIQEQLNTTLAQVGNDRLRCSRATGNPTLLHPIQKGLEESPVR